MALRGDLASVDLAQVFQMLALNKKVGLLSIQSPRLWKVLYFDTRGVTLYYNAHAVLDRCVATFVRVGRIQQATAEEVREHASRNGLELLDTLLAGGYLTEGELAAQMRYEVEEEVYELFFCKDARFEFLEGVDSMPEREGVVDERFFFNTESVIMEAARRIDEWSYIAERISNGLEVFCRTKIRPEPEDVGEECAIVYDSVDGRRNVARIVEVSGLSSFAVFKSLSQLLDGAFVEQMAADKLIKVGQTCVKEGRAQDAINLFEKAIELGVGIPDAHSMAAQAYETAGEYENSIYHLKCDAEYRLAASDVRGAAQRLLAAGRLVPTDLAARERLVEIVLTHDVRLPDYDPLAKGKELVTLLMAAGDLRRVRSILERMLTVSPDDLDLKKLLVSVHTKAGDQARVIQLYDSIAATLVRQHRPIEAIAYLQKILMLDRSRSDISDRVRALYAQDERSRSRRRAMATLGVLCLLLVGLAVAYSFYDRAATDAFERLDVKAMLADDQYDEAAGVFAQFLAEYPLVTAATRAKEELARIDGLRLRHAAALLNRSAATERELQRLRTEYKAEWRKHEEQFLGGQPEAALRSIERVRGLLHQTGKEDDLAWALEQQVEKTYAKIHEFIVKAGELEQQSREELAAGRVANAWALAVELVTEYNITAAARRTLVPVWLDSRPKGARILRDGVPVAVDVDGVRKELVTPAVLQCGVGDQAVQLQLEGFEPATARIDPVKQASVVVPLAIIPVQRIRFAERVMSPIGADADWVVAGLRNGRVGVGYARTGGVRQVFVLGGLKELIGRPVVVGGRTWFLTNELTLESYGLESGRPSPGWPVRLTSPAVTELVAQDGRLMFVDQRHVLRCYDLGSGQQLWSTQLAGVPAGPPQLEGRTVRLADSGGGLSILDAADGTVRQLLRSPVGISTRVLREGDKMIFGGTDGAVRAVGADGRVAWTARLGRTLLDGDIAVGRSAVYALGKEGIVRLDLADGRKLGSAALEGSLVGMQIAGSRLVVTVRLARTRERSSRDRVRVFDLEDLALAWEYEDETELTGAPSVDGRFVAVSGADGDVVLFR